MQPIPDLTRRTRRYWMIDGLAELMIGSIFLLTGVAQLAPLVVPAAIAGWVNLLLPLALILAILFSRQILHTLKARLTYPRTGYVAYRQPRLWQHVLGGLVGLGVGIALVNLTFDVRLATAWMPVIIGVTLAGGMTYLGAYLDLPRFYALAMFIASVGLLIHWLAFDGFLGASLVIIAAGAWMLVAGGITLYRYLQRTHVEEQL
ncbi:MAG: hypothetical protein N2385_12565 [Chloroflexus sp.]|nr:hypothetical protein [Chloroflexus sp.]